MRKQESEREADLRAKKAIAEMELMKIKRQRKKLSSTTKSSNNVSYGAKFMFMFAVVLAIGAYMRQHTPEETKMTFTEAKEYCAEQGKLLPLTMDDDPEHLLNVYALEGKAYWSADKKLLYNMNTGHTSYPPNAKHYVLCVAENGKTGASPIGPRTVDFSSAK